MGKLVNFCAGADSNKLPEKINGLLLNVPDHGANDRKIEKAKKMFEIARPQHFMLDSGGYQLLMAEKKSRKISFDPELPVKHTAREINLTPKHGMQAAAILQTEIVVGQDFPINDKLKEALARQIEFIKKQEYNVPWAFESAAWHKNLCPQAKFFLPIQCYDLEQLEIFFNRINGLYFDGVSMPIRGIKIWEVALFLIRFYQLRIPRVHLLGTSSFFVIALCAYVARHMFDWVSLDATSWRKAAEKSDFFNPIDLSRENLGYRATIDTEIENDCPCPHCKGISFYQIKEIPFKNRVALLRNHNWWVLERAFHDLYENSTDVIQLERFLRKRSKRPAEIDELCRTLSLVDVLKDADIILLQDLLGFKSQKKSLLVPGSKPYLLERQCHK